MGLAGCVLVLVAWGVSSFKWIHCYRYDGTHNRQYCFGQGYISLYHSTGPALDNSGWQVGHFRNTGAAERLGLRVLPRIFRQRKPAILTLKIPIWLALVVIALPTAILWYRDRRPPKGHCQSCGYDLTGNVSGICPECGASI